MKALLVGATLLVVLGHAQAIVGYNYPDVLGKSLLFYEAQRSGRLPSTNRIPWRGNSALGDAGSNGEDLTGGWYDAGDQMKYGFPMAFSTVVLTWGLLRYQSVYVAAGQYNYALDGIKWPLDYFIKCHTSKYEFYGQVGNTNSDHSYWGRPEDMTMSRPAYKITAAAPGSDLAALTASALAAGYLAFQNVNSTYAAILLQHARDLYDFATTYQGNYVQAIPDAGTGGYGGWGYNDEIAWAAVWLYKATGQQSYLTAATTTYYDSNTPGFGVGSMHAGYKLLLYELTGKSNTQYSNEVFWYLSYWIGGGFPYTPNGLLYASDWGSLRYAANQAFIALVGAELGINVNAFRSFGKNQINYALGDGGRSYVVGFGNNPPVYSHHRAASCPWPPATCDWSTYTNPSPNPHVIVGALAGGPGIADNFTDSRQNYRQNEVATDYNACFTSAVAALQYLKQTNQY